MEKVFIGINVTSPIFWPMVGGELADCLRLLADELEGVENVAEIDGIDVSDAYGNPVGKVLVR